MGGITSANQVDLGHYYQTTMEQKLHPDHLKEWNRYQGMHKRPYLYDRRSQGAVMGIGLAITAWSACTGALKSWKGVVGIVASVVGGVAMHIFKCSPDLANSFALHHAIINHLKGRTGRLETRNQVIETFRMNSSVGQLFVWNVRNSFHNMNTLCVSVGLGKDKWLHLGSLLHGSYSFDNVMPYAIVSVAKPKSSASNILINGKDSPISLKNQDISNSIHPLYISSRLTTVAGYPQLSGSIVSDYKIELSERPCSIPLVDAVFKRAFTQPVAPENVAPKHISPPKLRSKL